MLGAGKTQRLISIRKRRHEERIQKILAAAHIGDLVELKILLKVSKLESFQVEPCKGLNLVQGQAGVNLHDSFKRTPLHVAASEGKVNLCSKSGFLNT